MKKEGAGEEDNRGWGGRDPEVSLAKGTSGWLSLTQGMVRWGLGKRKVGAESESSSQELQIQT